MRITLTVNGRMQDIDVAPDTTLLSALRDDLGLTGTRYGCGHGVCGACFVLANGDPVPACMWTVDQAVGKEIVTIEGLATPTTLHPVQRTFVEEDAMQCGYCTSGMIISAAALLAHTPSPTDAEIRAALTPHLCRCGVYGRVIRAVRRAAQ
jgi:aerobic-type carbon monoxide dehydrogenase small subunit (CoxS/CutS family)